MPPSKNANASTNFDKTALLMAFSREYQHISLFYDGTHRTLCCHERNASRGCYVPPANCSALESSPKDHTVHIEISV